MQVVELKSLGAKELDSCLAHGWFRMNQTIFTTNIEWLKDSLYIVIWLRLRLEKFLPDKKYKELYKKNSGFKIEFAPAVITEKLEQLFAMYKESKPFEASSSLQSLLYNGKRTNVYNTWMINIYNNKELIGAGFFDIGKNSAAGISSFYHPAYNKNGLGLFIIYEKIFHCQALGLQFFYPGYYAPHYPAFDYKLKIGKQALEFFDPEQQEWRSFY